MQPFIKSVGGKTSLLPELMERVPRQGWDAYCEPFVGGGALFFRLCRAGLVLTREALLADSNAELIQLYQHMRDGDLFTPLYDRTRRLFLDYNGATLTNKEGLYYEQRARWNAGDHAPEVQVFLRQAGYNGLWRENKKGMMNTPWGKYETMSPEVLGRFRGCHAALAGVLLVAGDFRKVLDPLLVDKRRWLVYLDPPYYNSFTGYTAQQFTVADQEYLVKMAAGLDRMGHLVIYSNDVGMERRVAALWPAAEIARVQNRRSVSCLPNGRGAKTELLVVGATLAKELGR